MYESFTRHKIVFTIIYFFIYKNPSKNTKHKSACIKVLLQQNIGFIIIAVVAVVVIEIIL